VFRIKAYITRDISFKSKNVTIHVVEPPKKALAASNFTNSISQNETDVEIKVPTHINNTKPSFKSQPESRLSISVEEL
jgi:hypothetical protein